MSHIWKEFTNAEWRAASIDERREMLRNAITSPSGVDPVGAGYDITRFCEMSIEQLEDRKFSDDLFMGAFEFTQEHGINWEWSPPSSETPRGSP